MNLHLALKTIWTVETDAGPLRLRLKHFKPKQKKNPKGFTASSIFIYTQKPVLHASVEREREKKEEVVSIVLHQLLGLTALNRSIMQTHSKVFIFGAHHKT